MDDILNQTLFYIFVLSLILLLAVYYLGVTTEVATFSNAFSTLIQVATGRNPTTGQFAAYPK